MDSGYSVFSRFLIDITRPENRAFGIEVENRLYPLRRFAVYKLDTTRMHRAANYNQQFKKISFIVQTIADLRNFIEYRREHLNIYSEVLARNFPLSPHRDSATPSKGVLVIAAEYGPDLRCVPPKVMTKTSFGHNNEGEKIRRQRGAGSAAHLIGLLNVNLANSTLPWRLLSCSSPQFLLK